MKGSPDIIKAENHKKFNGFCIEFKSLTNNCNISDEQLKLKNKFIRNGYKFLISNNCDSMKRKYISIINLRRRRRRREYCDGNFKQKIPYQIICCFFKRWWTMFKDFI